MNDHLLAADQGTQNRPVPLAILRRLQRQRAEAAPQPAAPLTEHIRSGKSVNMQKGLHTAGAGCLDLQTRRQDSLALSEDTCPDAWTQNLHPAADAPERLHSAPNVMPRDCAAMEGSTAGLQGYMSQDSMSSILEASRRLAGCLGGWTAPLAAVGAIDLQRGLDLQAQPQQQHHQQFQQQHHQQFQQQHHQQFQQQHHQQFQRQHHQQFQQQPHHSHQLQQHEPQQQQEGLLKLLAGHPALKWAQQSQPASSQSDMTEAYWPQQQQQQMPVARAHGATERPLTDSELQQQQQQLKQPEQERVPARPLPGYMAQVQAQATPQSDIQEGLSWQFDDLDGCEEVMAAASAEAALTIAAMPTRLGLNLTGLAPLPVQKHMVTRGNCGNRNTWASALPQRAQYTGHASAGPAAAAMLNLSSQPGLGPVPLQQLALQLPSPTDAIGSDGTINWSEWQARWEALATPQAQAAASTSVPGSGRQAKLPPPVPLWNAGVTPGKAPTAAWQLAARASASQPAPTAAAAVVMAKGPRAVAANHSTGDATALEGVWSARLQELGRRGGGMGPPAGAGVAAAAVQAMALRSAGSADILPICDTPVGRALAQGVTGGPDRDRDGLGRFGAGGHVGTVGEELLPQLGDLLEDLGPCIASPPQAKGSAAAAASGSTAKLGHIMAVEHEGSSEASIRTPRSDQQHQGQQQLWEQQQPCGIAPAQVGDHGSNQPTNIACRLGNQHSVDGNLTGQQGLHSQRQQQPRKQQQQQQQHTQRLPGAAAASSSSGTPTDDAQSLDCASAADSHAGACSSRRPPPAPLQLPTASEAYGMPLGQFLSPDGLLGTPMLLSPLCLSALVQDQDGQADLPLLSIADIFSPRSLSSGRVGCMLTSPLPSSTRKGAAAAENVSGPQASGRKGTSADWMVPTGAFLATADTAATAAAAAIAVSMAAANGLPGCKEALEGSNGSAAATPAAAAKKGALLSQGGAFAKATGGGRGRHGGAKARGRGRPPKPSSAAAAMAVGRTRDHEGTRSAAQGTLAQVGQRQQQQQLIGCDALQVHMAQTPSVQQQLTPAAPEADQQVQPLLPFIRSAAQQQQIMDQKPGQHQQHHGGQQQKGRKQQKQGKAERGTARGLSSSLAEFPADAHAWVTSSAGNAAETAMDVENGAAAGQKEVLVLSRGPGGSCQGVDPLLANTQAGTKESHGEDPGDQLRDVHWWDLAPLDAEGEVVISQHNSLQRHSGVAPTSLQIGSGSHGCKLAALGSTPAAAPHAPPAAADTAAAAGSPAARAGPASAAAELSPHLAAAIEAAIVEDTPFVDVQELPLLAPGGWGGLSSSAIQAPSPPEQLISSSHGQRQQHGSKMQLQISSKRGGNKGCEVVHPASSAGVQEQQQQQQCRFESGKRKRAQKSDSSQEERCSGSDGNDSSSSLDEETDLDEDPEALPGFCRKVPVHSTAQSAELASVPPKCLESSSGCTKQGCQQGVCTIDRGDAAGSGSREDGTSSAPGNAAAASAGDRLVYGSLQGDGNGSTGAQGKGRGHQRKCARSQVCRLAVPVE